MPALRPPRDPIDVGMGLIAGLLIWAGLGVGLFFVLVLVRRGLGL